MGIWYGIEVVSSRDAATLLPIIQAHTDYLYQMKLSTPLLTIAYILLIQQLGHKLRIIRATGIWDRVKMQPCN